MHYKLSNESLNSFTCMFRVCSINTGDLSEAASMMNNLFQDAFAYRTFHTLISLSYEWPLSSTKYSTQEKYAQ